MTRTAGFIGAGRMGGAIARRIADDPAWEVLVYDPSPEALRRFNDSRARIAASPRELAECSTYVVSSLPLPEDVDRLYSEAGIANALRPDNVLVDLSTIDPYTGRRAADAVEATGAAFVASPLGMGPRQAADGTLPLYLGGTNAALERAAPVLDAISKNQHVIGGVEQAYAAKLAINYVSMSNLAVLLEGFGIGAAAGIDHDLLCKLMQDGGARSFQSDVRLPWILAGDFTPRFGVDLAQKDMRLAIDLAARYHAPASTGAAALQHFSSAQRAGLGGSDIGALWNVVCADDRAERA
ncbi:MAG: hgd [Candidatus Eremiobacteraeota bacterium]|nr:hgd [Candidatus Eremiobacteraeota bacterium]